MITKQELEKLKELAGKATCGPWEYYEGEVEHHSYPISMMADGYSPCGIFPIANSTFVPLDMQPINGSFIAAANPDTVLRLIEALEVAIKSLIKIRVNCSCTELCMCSEDDVYIAQEALNKIYGVE